METWLDQYEQRVCSADDAEAEIDRLRAEVELLKAELTRSYVLRNDVLKEHAKLTYAPTAAPARVWQDLADALAAEVRELRRDRARLDWLASERRSFNRYSSGITFYVYDSNHLSVGRGMSLREAIDAALSARPEESR